MVGVLPPEPMQVQLAAEEARWKHDRAASFSKYIVAAKKSKHAAESDSVSMRVRLGDKAQEFRSMQQRAFQQDKVRVNLKHRVDALQQQISDMRQADKQVKEASAAESRDDLRQMSKLDRERASIKTKIVALHDDALAEKQVIDKRHRQVQRMLKDASDNIQATHALQEQDHDLEIEIGRLKEEISAELHDAGEQPQVEIGENRRQQQLGRILEITTQTKHDAEDLKVSLSAIKYQIKLDADLVEEKMQPSKREAHEVEANSRKEQQRMLRRTRIAEEAMRGLTNLTDERAALAQTRREKDARVSEGRRHEQMNDLTKLLNTEAQDQRDSLRAEARAAKRKLKELHHRKGHIADDLRLEQGGLEVELLAIKKKEQEEIRSYQQQDAKANGELISTQNLIHAKQKRVEQGISSLQQDLLKIGAQMREDMAGISKERQDAKAVEARVAAARNHHRGEIQRIGARFEGEHVAEKRAEQLELQQAETSSAQLRRQINEIKVEAIKRVSNLKAHLLDEEQQGLHSQDSLKMHRSAKQAAESVRTTETKLSQARAFLAKESALAESFKDELKELERMK